MPDCYPWVITPDSCASSSTPADAWDARGKATDRWACYLAGCREPPLCIPGEYQLPARLPQRPARHRPAPSGWLPRASGVRSMGVMTDTAPSPPPPPMTATRTMPARARWIWPRLSTPPSTPPRLLLSPVTPTPPRPPSPRRAKPPTPCSTPSARPRRLTPHHRPIPRRRRLDRRPVHRRHTRHLNESQRVGLAGRRRRRARRSDRVVDRRPMAGHRYTAHLVAGSEIRHPADPDGPP